MRVMGRVQLKKSRENMKVSRRALRDFHLVQWLRFCATSAKGLGLIAGQETRFHMLHLKSGASK